MNIKYTRIDWILLGSIFFLGCMSLVTLASLQMDFFWRQLIWWSIALCVLGISPFFNLGWLISQRWFSKGLYAISLLFLVASYFQKGTIRGTKSWIVIGNFQFEPVEIMKIALILLLATFFSKKHIAAWQGKNILSSITIVGIPGILVLAHPDLGSAIVIFIIWLSFLLVSGINVKRFFWGVLLVIFSGFLLWMFFLKPYQKDRLTGFIFPQKDPLGVNYNVIQSKIAIGSAGFLGKGFKEGTQSQLHFLPEPEADFIFASFVEEWGFLGGFAVIFSYFLILWRLAIIGLTIRDNYSKFIVLGGIILFITHFTFNVGSNLGLVPVTGITLPFFSYGGSSLLTISFLVSIIHNKKLESSV